MNKDMTKKKTVIIRGVKYQAIDTPLGLKDKPLGQKEWNSILSGCVLEAAFEAAVEGSRIDKTLTIPTHVRFRRGYTSISMTYKIESITIGLGKSEWGAGADPCFIIKFK